MRRGTRWRYGGERRGSGLHFGSLRHRSNPSPEVKPCTGETVYGMENIPGVGEAFIFRSGSYVTWGMNYEQSRKFLRSIIKGRPNTGGNAELESYLEIGDEEMEYIIAEDQITRVVGDVIVIGQQPRAQEELEGDYVDDTSSQS